MSTQMAFRKLLINVGGHESVAENPKPKELTTKGPNMNRAMFVLPLVMWGVFCADVDANYMKIDNPPDVDKLDRNGDGIWPDDGDNSCWLASAANILGAAGYGNSIAIYSELIGNFGIGSGGLAGTALNWYIAQHPGNCYSRVTEYNHSLWNSYWTPSFIASELRRCQFVGIGIFWDLDMRSGHALTVWGDDGNAEAPSWCWVTDSDRDQFGLDVNTYNWTLHPDVRGDGKNVYSLDYGTSPAYLGYVVTLCRVPDAGSTLVLAGLAWGLLLRSSKWRQR